jgi:hypothetical protein
MRFWNELRHITRTVQIELLALAWVLALISLPTPSEDTPVVLFLYRIPVCLFIASSFGAPFAPGFRWMTLIPISAVLFLLSPLTLLGRASPRRILIQRFASLGLLGAWAFPIVFEYFIPPGDKHLWGFRHVAWGYYLYAIANTIAFIAVQIRPGTPRADSRRGFAVVPSNREASLPPLPPIETRIDARH